MMNFELEAWQAVSFSILYALAILVAGWLISKWVRGGLLRALRVRRMDEALVRFVSVVAQYAVLIAAIIAALAQVGVETTSLLAVFASAGLAIGLALQGSLSNLASGIMILFFRPFDLGDVITAGGFTGRVDDIGLFATRLITPDNQTVILPNASVTSSSIINLTVRGTRRASVPVNVAYGVDVDRVQQVILSSIQGLPAVLAEPAPQVVFSNFAATSLEFTVFIWASADNWFPIQHEARRAVYNALSAAGIEIPSAKPAAPAPPPPAAAAPGTTLP